MKTSRGSHPGMIASALILAIFLNAIVYAAAQESVPAPSSNPEPQDRSVSPTSPAADQGTPASSSTSSTIPAQPAEDQLPNSPGTSQAQSGEASASQTPQLQQTQPQSPSPSRKPVGTAAAETVPTSGVAASRPAGSALAPAKQRRIRSILIRTGALVGAAAAIGVTMALSQGSPSKPPGAR